jgi:predicted component of type VI protein secretion system
MINERLNSHSNESIQQQKSTLMKSINWLRTHKKITAAVAVTLIATVAAIASSNNDHTGALNALQDVKVKVNNLASHLFPSGVQGPNSVSELLGGLTST